MTKDERESLTAWFVVSSVVSLACIALWLTPNDFHFPGWVLLIALGVSMARMLLEIIRLRRKPAEKPE